MVEVITSADFQTKVLQAKKGVLVDFYADWCVPCKMLAPVVEAVAEEFGDELLVGKLNIDENMNIAENYRVMNIPTLIFFRGGKEVNRAVGGMRKEELREFIRANL